MFYSNHTGGFDETTEQMMATTDRIKEEIRKTPEHDAGNDKGSLL
jgi:hypothetical protein